MKICSFTDIHFGNKNNSNSFNLDCLEFINWFIDQTKGIDILVMCGDWHHNRSNLNIATMNKSLDGLKLLSKAYKQIYLIIGNHDMYAKDNLFPNSLVFGNYIPNITVVDKPIIFGEHTLLPWLLEYPNIKKTKYLWGHFEIPGFILTAGHLMPDNEHYNGEFFSRYKRVFSGHFHKRQLRNNIVYFGNCFPHNYGDKNDFDRGGIIFDDQADEITFLNWDNCPKYMTGNLSDFLENPEDYLKGDKIYAKLLSDIPLEFEETNFIRDTFKNHFGLLELTIVNQNEMEDTEFEETHQFASISDIVIEGINKVESDFLNKNLLMEIYNQC